MTENEAVKYLTQINPKYVECVELVDMKEVWDNTPEAISVAEKALNEIQQYRSIGTVSECREAVEKQRAKKPIKYGDTKQGLDNNGNSISWQEDCYECPNCESFIGYVSDCKDGHYQDSYCRDCGQAIDWSDTE